MHKEENIDIECIAKLNSRILRMHCAGPYRMHSIHSPGGKTN